MLIIFLKILRVIFNSVKWTDGSTIVLRFSRGKARVKEHREKNTINISVSLFHTKSAQCVSMSSFPLSLFVNKYNKRISWGPTYLKLISLGEQLNQYDLLEKERGGLNVIL